MKYDSYSSSLQHFFRVTKNLLDLYTEKNKRYGDSFAHQVEEFGMAVPVIRLSDKMERLKYLVSHVEDNGGDESMKDTLTDIACYAIMSIMELEKEKIKESIGDTDNDKEVSSVEHLASN